MKKIIISLIFSWILIITGCAAEFKNATDNIKSSFLFIDEFSFFTDVIPANSDSTSEFPDLFYEFRLAELNARSPLDLDFNDHVKEYIFLFLTERRDQISKVLGLSEYYFPIFEEILDKYQLPFELKYLTVVESALNPKARSTSGAMGLWQFKYNSAKMFDLKIDSYVDERCDPVKSTEAACKYLKYLYGIFNDWNLAIVAYNTGPGVVRNVIERANGETDFWKLYAGFPESAGDYISAFIAVNYILNFYSEHNIIPIGPRISFFETDTVQVKQSLHFSDISGKTGVSEELLEFLNPQFKLNYIPVVNKNEILVLPTGYLLSFIQNENSIYSSSSGTKHSAFLVDKPDRDKKIIHTVQKGEFLHKIALIYHCNIENIIDWNNLESNILQEGQSLIIYVNKNFKKLY